MFKCVNIMENNNNNLIKEINDYKPQLLKTKLKTNYNLLYWRVRKFAYNLPLNHINGKKEEKLLADSSSILYVCFLLPQLTSSQRLIDLIECMCCFLFIDDYMGFEKSQQGFNDLIAVLNGIKKAQTPAEKYISVVFSKIKRSYTDEQYNNLMKRFYEYFYYCKIEMNLMNELEAKDRDSVEKILGSKHHTNGTNPWFALIEYGLEINVNKHFCDKRLQRYAKLANAHNSYVNDIFSLKKECINNELRFNTIYCYYKEGNSIEKCVKILLEKLDEIEEEMLKLKNIIEKDSSTDTQLRKYLDAIETECSGNIMWSMFTPRYNVYNKLAINDIFCDFNHFIELRDEFDSN